MWNSGERLAAELKAPDDFFHSTRLGWHVVLELNRRGHLPAVLLHRLKNLGQRRVARPPGQVLLTIRGRGAVLQVEAGDAPVVASEKSERGAPGGPVVPEI